MRRRPVARTRLAEWLNQAMASWQDPETRELGLSGRRLAELSGISQAMIWEMLKTHSVPKPEILMRLARFFSVSPLFLFRLAYLPDSIPIPTETLNRLQQLEDKLSRLPEEKQKQTLESLAQLLKQ